VSFSPISSRGRRFSLRGFLAALSFLLAASGAPLDLRAQTPDPFETLRIDTDLVNLSVSVFNRNSSRTVAPLEQKDFAIVENGQPQEILFFASGETPFDLVLLLDLSGSTVDKIDLIRKSSRRFVDAARPSDRIAICAFAAEVQVVARLSSDHSALKKSIDDIEKPGGGTNFWDALRFVIEHVLGQSRAENRRSAIVVMTDGVDNALPEVFGEGSATSFADLLKVVQGSDTIVLPIYLDTEKEADKRGMLKNAYARARQDLALLAAESGNAIYQARKLKDLEGVYEQVMRDLSTVYSIGYRPTNRPRDGSWREIAVQLLGHPDLAVRAKHGYFGK